MVLNQRQRMFVSLGEALSAWQSVETILGQIFRFLVLPTDSVTADIILNSMHVNVKLRVIDELISHHVKDKEAKAQWEKVLKRIRRKIDDRNSLVHWAFVSVQSGGNEPQTVLTRSLNDFRNLNTKDELGIPFKTFWTESEINKHADEFRKILSDLFPLMKKCLVARKP